MIVIDFVHKIYTNRVSYVLATLTIPKHIMHLLRDCEVMKEFWTKVEVIDSDKYSIFLNVGMCN